METKSSALPGAGRGTGCGAGTHPSGNAVSRGRLWEERGSSSSPFIFQLICSLLHSAVASQLVPRGTWRHLVSVRTGAGTVEGCGRFSSIPVAGEEAADIRLQGVTGSVTPKREDPAGGSAIHGLIML